MVRPRIRQQEIDIEIRNMGGRKAHGGDEIPGREYKAARKWKIEQIARIENHVKMGKNQKNGLTAR